jgi:hypothetical protein
LGVDLIGALGEKVVGFFDLVEAQDPFAELGQVGCGVAVTGCV